MKVWGASAFLGDIGVTCRPRPKSGKLLDSDDPRVVMEAEKALGKTKDTESLDKLTKLMKKHDELAVRVRSRQGPGARSVTRGPSIRLIEALADEDKEMIQGRSPGSLAEDRRQESRGETEVLLQDGNESPPCVSGWPKHSRCSERTREWDYLESVLSWGEEGYVQGALLSIVNVPG